MLVNTIDTHGPGGVPNHSLNFLAILIRVVYYYIMYIHIFITYSITKMSFFVVRVAKSMFGTGYGLTPNPS